MSSSRNPSTETVTEKLLGSHQDEEEYPNPYVSTAELKRLKRWRALAIFSTGLLLVSLIYNMFQPHTRSKTVPRIPYTYCMFTKSSHSIVKLQVLRHLFPAPAQDAVTYEIKVFHSSFNDDRTPYQGPPTDAVDAAWEDLYNGKF
jgi:hypothetical protein